MAQAPTSPATPQANSAGLELGPSRLWSMDLIDEILVGTRDPKLLRVADRKGLTAAAFAAMRGAAAADRLAPLLQLLEPVEDGEDRIAQLQQTLAVMVEAQLRLEAKVDALTALLTAVASRKSGSNAVSGGPLRRTASTG